MPIKIKEVVVVGIERSSGAHVAEAMSRSKKRKLKLKKNKEKRRKLAE